MSELYPLKFNPIIKDYLWGGNKLKEVLHKKYESDTAAESWELSGVDGNVSVVAEGKLSGKTLRELIAEYGADLLGKTVYDRFGDEFPVLIKFIDAQKDLSVQLHPDDELARKRHNSFGKTEMWYIMEAEPGSELIVGFNRATDPEEYQEALDKGELLSLLNKEQVSEGDTYFIKAGKVHAIGAGILLAEIQQTSNITYRLYDYDRTDKDGNTRELHTELAKEAIDYSARDDHKVDYHKQYNTSNKMVESPYFTTNFLNISATFVKQLVNRDSFTVYMCVDGKTQVSSGDFQTTLQKGETLLVPSVIKEINFSARQAKLLEVYL
ncbi:type I phosphomannose isomerase catalytic subunit [Robertkochia aurantiaca]|uniref:type I phosphomannose isomerase catalytic subunit n=1 Tax=Robertkochia aurantiaca TaxID=2873700 RepID=UPI001CCC7653|nr:type I phosphomannose isomerase catalytic subunit [Robertkochia sp. 3YJGBD-33]